MEDSDYARTLKLLMRIQELETELRKKNEKIAGLEIVNDLMVKALRAAAETLPPK